jgi:hypothetical protein
MLAFGTQLHGFKPGRSRQIFKGENILSTPSFGGKVKPSVSCRRFAACKRSIELCGSQLLGQIVATFLAHEEFYLPLLEVSRIVEREGTERRRWEHLRAGERNGYLPLRTCPGCNVPEPYRSPDWALVPAKPA